MEIHPPHERPRSLRDFLVHMAMITLGVLIALACDGLVEARHHRAMAREARATIQQELRDNLRQVESYVGDLGKFDAARLAMIRVADDFIAHRDTSGHIDLQYPVIAVTTAAWQTAGSTGAIAFLDFPEVRDYAVVYDLQQKLDHLQTSELATEVARIDFPEKPEELTAAQWQEWKQRVQSVASEVGLQASLARQLSDAYRKVLKKWSPATARPAAPAAP